jgi:hypothetical protein
MADTPCEPASLRWTCTWRDPLMNTIIYIVGLVVVVGFILSFIGLI